MTKSDREVSASTFAVHAMRPHAQDGAFNVGIVPNSTYVQQSAGEWETFTYGRTNGPTEMALRDVIAKLENAQSAICFSSGIAAISAIADLVAAGEKIVVMSDVYGGTHRFFSQFSSARGIEVTFIDTSRSELPEDSFANAKLIFVETPSNPRLLVTDLSKLATHAKAAGAILAVDNTMATPINQRPLELGADIVIHSTSKYLSGHTNVVGGAVAVNSQELGDRLHFIRKATGAVPSPFDCYLVMLGIKTLPLRMNQHHANASAVAQYLSAQSVVNAVHFLGAVDHPQAELIQKQMSGPSGIISFELDSAERAKKFVNSLELFSPAVSFGSVASLVEHPKSMSHKDIPEGSGAPEQLVRLSVGIEDIEDLIADLSQALAAL